MSRAQAGFGLLEALLALALGLMLLAAASQVFVAAYQAWRLQGAAARLQDDARLALHRMAQDIRMTGMSGCLRQQAITFDTAAAAQAFAQPLRITLAGDGRLDSLSLVLEQLPGSARQPAWTLLTDCRSWAQVKEGRHPGNERTLAFPIARITYQLRAGNLRRMSGSQAEALIDHVRDLRATLVPTAEGGRVDLQLTLFEPQQRIELQHELSVALRNRLPEP
ncbi:PilW family protein [Pseudomonas sp. HLMP]|uniref:PilW family protein n=1 Tax=Pseudomonas sp. HLMP TaxID=3153767 RepID=UPI003966E1F9